MVLDVEKLLYLSLVWQIKLKHAMAIGEQTLTVAMQMRNLRLEREYHLDVGVGRGIGLIKRLFDTKIHDAALILLLPAFVTCLSQFAESQDLPYTGNSSSSISSIPSDQLEPAYLRPTEKTKFKNYVFDGFGPYPVVVAGVVAGVNQWTDSPPEWNQGAEGYGKRFGSNFGIAAASTTTRYALSEALKEDTRYYSCECSGALPRMGHAMLSTLTARRGEDGHNVFSLPALIAPYAGSVTAVYGWYPDRYGAKDALRMGNYSLLGYVGGNIALEFLYSGPHSLLSRVHLGKMHGASASGPNN
jgi:hypothetical protein